MLGLFAVVGCYARSQTTSVLCAASLVPMVQQSAAATDVPLSIQGAGSRTLVQQVQNGSDAELLLLADSRLLPEVPSQRVAEHKTFASNSLELVASPAAPETTAQKLLEAPETTLAVADPVTAPLGEYSRQALEHLSHRAHLVTLKDASAVLAAVESGHADLGLIYHSDSLRGRGLKTLLAVPPSWHDSINYEAVLLTPAGAQARKLYQYWSSEKGKALVLSQGLLIPQAADQ